MAASMDFSFASLSIQDSRSDLLLTALSALVRTVRTIIVQIAELGDVKTTGTSVARKHVRGLGVSWVTRHVQRAWN